MSAAAILAGLQLFASYQKAEAMRNAAYAQYDEYIRVGDETIATAKYNIRRREEDRFFNVLGFAEQGQQQLGFAVTEGKRRIGTMESEMGTSGAEIGEGTTADVLTYQALQNSKEQLGIAQATSKGISAIRQQTKSANRTELYNAIQQRNRLYRQADLTREGADDMYLANILSGIVGGATTYNSFT